MCGCADRHPGIQCRDKGCHCHDMVYMSISILRVPVDKMQHITSAVMAAADTNEVSVSFSEPASGDDD